MKWRDSKEYRHWVDDVIERDGCCVICNTKENLQAHHVKNGQHHPESRYDIDNGVTLCGGSMESCHTQFHCNYKKGFRHKATKDDWDNFLYLVNYVKGLKC